MKHHQDVWQRLMGQGLGLVLVGIMLLLGIVGLTPPAWAVVSESGITAAAEVVDGATSDISTEKVTQFVQAYRQVIELIEQREPELRSAETQSEALELEAEIETAAIQAIEATGLTASEYLQLLGLANNDGELSQRIVTQLQESS